MYFVNAFPFREECRVGVFYFSTLVGFEGHFKDRASEGAFLYMEKQDACGHQFLENG